MKITVRPNTGYTEVPLNTDFVGAFNELLPPSEVKLTHQMRNYDPHTVYIKSGARVVGIITLSEQEVVAMGNKPINF